MEAHDKAVVQRSDEAAPSKRSRSRATVIALQRGSAADPPELDETPTTVQIASLVWAGSPRSRGEDEAHVRRLVETEWPLPPIVVHRRTMRIIDGYHRVSAATRKGFDEIQAYLVDGSDESTFIIAVQANVAHGLPLSLSDRRAAAAKILQTHAHWSDRAIGATTGLSAKTIRSIRCTTGENCELDDRLGKDGRVRPLNAAAGRQLAAELITKRPEASLREIAKAAGISASTVRDVRARLRLGQSPILTSNAEKRDASRAISTKTPRTGDANTSEPADTSPVLSALSKDPALRMNADGRELLRWLHQHAVNSVDSQQIPESVPDHCLDHLVELARRCSANWAGIAREWTRRSQLNRARHIDYAIY